MNDNWNAEWLAVGSISIPASSEDPSVEDLDRFARAIEAAGGMIQPILVHYPHGGDAPELLAGRVRLESARRYGWETVPCVILNLGREEAAVISLLEDHSGKRQPQLERAWDVARVLEGTGWSQAYLSSMTRLTESQISEAVSFADALPRSTVSRIADDTGAEPRSVADGLSRSTLRRLMPLTPKERVQQVRAIANCIREERPIAEAFETNSADPDPPSKWSAGGISIDLAETSQLPVHELAHYLIRGLWVVAISRIHSARIFAALRRASPREHARPSIHPDRSIRIQGGTK